MKKVLISTLLSLNAVAAINESVETWYDSKLGSASPNQYSVGFIHNQFEYSEPNMTDKGPLTGIAFSFKQNSEPQAFFLSANGEVSTGDVTYTGQTWGGRPLTGQNKYQVFDLSVRGNLPVTYGGDEIFITTFGLGYRNTHMFSGTMRGDYTRDITYVYLPIGAKYKLQQSLNWKSSVALELNLLRSGIVKTYLSEVDPSLPDVENKQSGGSGMKISYENIINKNYLVNLSALRWNVGKSDYAMLDSENYVYEPVNGTWVYSLTLGYVF